MSILNRLPVLRWRTALVGAERSLRQAKRELAGLRRRYEDQEARLTAEKQKRVRLEGKLTRRRERRAVAASRAAAADANSATVVSYPKSGRTWFSFLYYYYCLELLCERHLEHEFPIKPELDTTFHQLLGEHPELPKVAFSHCGMAGKKSYQAVSTDPDQFLTKPTIFIARDPRDVVVSHYYHLKYRNGLPARDVDLEEFIRGELGIRRVVAFMNRWAPPIQHRHVNLRVLYYEDLRERTTELAGKMLSFIGFAPINDAALGPAVLASSFDRLKARERERRRRLGLETQDDSQRMRRGVAGGYRALPPDDVAYLNRIVSMLDPVFERYQLASSD